MDYKKVLRETLSVIGRVSPAIAQAIGGNSGMAAGYILPILANAFGSKPTDVTNLLETIRTDPNAPEKLMEIDSEHASTLACMTEDMKHPYELEINVKVKWDNHPQA